MEEKKEKIIQIIVGTILFGTAILIDKLTNFNTCVNFIIYMVPYIVCAYDTFKEGIEEIKEGEIFSEQMLMMIASLGAMLIAFIPGSEPEFMEGIFVMLFFQVGEFFEIIAEGESEKSIESLMNIRPDYANIYKGKKLIKVDPGDVKVGDIIVCNPGEKIPLDGIVVKGSTYVDTIAITGESVPRKIEINSDVYSGFVNKNGVIEIKVTKSFGDSTASKIIDLVKNASSKKTSNEKFITKFSKIYTPLVIVAALLIGIIPSIVTGNVVIWLSRALSFLVVSCPCALVISVPLAYFGGIGGSSKKGILFKGSNYLEAVSKIDTVVFDKTGTLTEGVFEVSVIHPNEINENELLHIAAHVEEHSTHPIAVSLIESYKSIGNEIDNCKISDVKEISGKGVEAKVNGEQIFVGNKRLMESINIKVDKCKNAGTTIYVASKEKYYGHIVISDKIKSDTFSTIEYLKKNNIRTIMLTGDNKDVAKEISNNLNIDEYHAELLPQDKVDKIDEVFKSNNHKENMNVAFIGDGINDAPVIARCDIGIAMGGIGSDAAIEASDVVFMNDKLSSLITAFNISKKTTRIAKENIFFSIFIKLLVLVLCALGIANMWIAVLADVGVTVLAVLNSMRTLR